MSSIKPGLRRQNKNLRSLLDSVATEEKQRDDKLRFASLALADLLADEMLPVTIGGKKYMIYIENDRLGVMDHEPALWYQKLRIVFRIAIRFYRGL